MSCDLFIQTIRPSKIKVLIRLMSFAVAIPTLSLLRLFSLLFYSLPTNLYMSSGFKVLSDPRWMWNTSSCRWSGYIGLRCFDLGCISANCVATAAEGICSNAVYSNWPKKLSWTFRMSEKKSRTRTLLNFFPAPDGKSVLCIVAFSLNSIPVTLAETACAIQNKMQSLFMIFFVLPRYRIDADCD